MRGYMTELILVSSLAIGFGAGAPSSAQDGKKGSPAKEYTIGAALKDLAANHESGDVRAAAKDFLEALEGEDVPPNIRTAVAAKLEDDAKTRDGALVWVAVYALDKVQGYLLLDHKRVPGEDFSFLESPRAMKTLDLLRQIGEPAINPIEAYQEHAKAFYLQVEETRLEAIEEIPGFELEPRHEELMGTLRVAMQQQMFAVEALSLIREGKAPTKP